MDKYKIVGEFTDIHTNQKYMPGEEIEFSKERVKEILKVGELIEPIPESSDKPKAKTK